MIQGIASLGEGRTQRRTKTRVAMWLLHLFGGALGGSAVAVGAWLSLTPIRAFAPTLFVAFSVAAVALLAILVDLHVLNRPLKGRQVPSTWFRRYGALRSYWMFGVFLGGGLSAHVPHAVTYAVFSAIALLIGLPDAIACGALFGAGRTAIVGPAALVPDVATRILYISRSSRWAFPKMSAVVSALLIAVTAQAVL